MGWSFRKSFGSGPFRVNFSNSGVSYSVGVKGARVNMGPRGTYVNLSSHGISYRKKISGEGMHPSQVNSQVPLITYNEVHNIASADIGQLTDTDSMEFISELTQKAGQLSYTTWFGIVPLVFFLAFLLFSSFAGTTTVTQPATDSVLAKITSDVGVNIRKAAYSKAAVLTTAGRGQSFLLTDSTNQKWLKIRLHDSVGFVSRRFAAITHIHHDEVQHERTMLSNPYAGYEILGGLICFTPLFIFLKRKDKRRFEMELMYEMDEQLNQVYEQFGKHFANFSKSAKIWQYLNAQNTLDFKRNGGAGKLIKRVALRSRSTNRAPLPHFITNVSIPFLKLNNIEFYFLPERLLVKRNNTFAAVFYKHLNINNKISQFLEEEGVAGDAQVVGSTWRYVNKNGGPDRRFNNNRQIPICAYSEYTLTSDTGVYEVITTSKQGAMDGFAAFIQQIGGLQAKMAIS